MAGVVEHLMPGVRRPRPDADGRPPTAEELDLVLRAAVSVPDHGLLRPWRFVVITGGARQRFGDALAADAVVDDGNPAMAERARAKAFGAPTHIVVLASPDREAKVPEWEQEASAACCGYAIILAATGLGLGAVWKSTVLRDGAALRRLLVAGEHERVLGWIGIGSPRAGSDTRPKWDSSKAPVTVLS